MRVRGWVHRAKVDWKNVKGRYTSRVPIACMRALLEYEAMADPDTQRRFEGWARGEYRDIRFEVDLSIARKMGRYFELPRYSGPNLARFFKEAAKLEKAGSYRDAIEIYKGVSESIGVHMDLIPDKGGDCAYMMIDALENIAKCVLAAGLDDAGRREYIRYMADWSMRVIDWYTDEYGKALASICQNHEDLDLWEGILDDPPQVEPDYSGPSETGMREIRKILAARRKSMGGRT